MPDDVPVMSTCFDLGFIC